MGATFGMVLCGWPWHPRFSRYSRPAPRWQTLPPPPAPEMHRVYINSPATMAECGGPCCQAMDPRACTCGELWVDVPADFPHLVQRGDTPQPPTYRPDWSPCSQPPNDPSSQP